MSTTRAVGWIFLNLSVAGDLPSRHRSSRTTDELPKSPNEGAFYLQHSYTTTFKKYFLPLMSDHVFILEGRPSPVHSSFVVG
jgi:hypothetical protein